MAILDVAKLGHPILRQVAEAVSLDEAQSSGFQNFIDDMVETMRKLDGVGLAAPQVSCSKQVVVIASEANPRYPDESDLPLMVLINPRLTERSDERIEGWEACLSVKDLRGKVRRHRKVRVEAFDRHMNPLSFETEGFLSIVLQHEIDHLNGKVFLDRMEDFSTLTHLEEFDRFWMSQATKV